MMNDKIVCIISLCLIILFILSIVYFGNFVNADTSEECKIFWKYPKAGYYLVSEIDGEYQIRVDLYNLRSACVK